MTIFRLNDAVANVESGQTGLAPKDPNGAGAPTKVTDVAEPAAGGEKEGTIKEIILKGPMSHAFTEVLNIMLDRKTNPEGVLRKESVQMAVATFEAAEEDPDVMGDQKAYVYVYNGQVMSLGDVVNMVEAAQVEKEAHPESQVVVVVDQADKVVQNPATAKAMGMATSQLRQEGITLFLRKESAVNWVKSKFFKG